MRVSGTAVIATLSAAALLVVGVDYATFAATGDSLVLGRINHQQKTTVLTKHGTGPALRLTTRGNERPSLAVSSSARVRKLNADLLDGQSASALSSRAVTYKAGNSGDVLQGLSSWRQPVEPGIYQVSFKAFLNPDSPAPGNTVDVICGVADLNTIGPRTHVYTADSATFTGTGFPTLMSGAETVRIGDTTNPGIVCTTTGGAFMLFKPITASWTPINHRTVKVAQPATLAPAARRAFQRSLGR